MQKHYITANMDTVVGKTYVVSGSWKWADRRGAMKVRWSYGRNNYKVKQGLYAIGQPDADSSVFVSANYKLSFDHLRRALNGMNAWILVLDTKGVNVWCAAGKGTFGTKELVYRIKAHGLEKLLNHRKVIVPQLGATGVSAHEVREKTGFHVIYGPVRANDIKEFVSKGFKATPEMRKVTFPVWERIKLIPVEIAYGKYYLALVPAVIFLLSGLNPKGYSLDLVMEKGSIAVINLFASYFAGCALTPLLLPWIPFRAFSLKGLFNGWLVATLLLFFHLLGNGIIEIVSWYLIIGSIASFMAMNFTGSSTYTSLSGVQKEMKFSLPSQIIAASIGLAGWIVSRFIDMI